MVIERHGRPVAQLVPVRKRRISPLGAMRGQFTMTEGWERALTDEEALLWALGEPERLSVKARRLVEAGENVVSVASYWEVVIKTQKGRLSIDDLATWWRRATELTSARILHIRPSHITAFAALPMLHTDPFDRILVAQARTEDLGIVTSDGPTSEYLVQTVW